MWHLIGVLLMCFGMFAFDSIKVLSLLFMLFGLLSIGLGEYFDRAEGNQSE